MDGRKYPWGDEPPVDGSTYRCNFAPENEPKFWGRDGFRWAAPAGSFPKGASPWGMLDMAGNVWEWCRDWYSPSYRGAEENPRGAPEGTKRVLRGGSFNTGPDALRCANRAAHVPEFYNPNVGFRCVRMPKWRNE